MKCKLVLVGLYILLVGFQVFCQVEDDENEVDQQYDYFKLVLRWPNSYCKTNTCRKTVPQRFTIHGLWPQRKDGTDLTYCDTTETLTDATLNSFKSDLLEYWPDLSTNNFEASKSLWRYQWEKHGTCSASKFNAQEYIERAILRTKNNDVLPMLKNAGIQPYGASYSTSRIQKAIKDITLHNPDIKCNKDAKKNIYLYEIHICFEYNGRVIRDCRNRVIDCENKNPIFASRVEAHGTDQASLLEDQVLDFSI
ncbi:Ribonuclease [Quillaja saponaria]|uniref:Ribonuclease n=1 Tax=Quillaja saponaria TaxID=32244 RepID=A0AAD7Q4C0_QUISA|nr:Ribonuclease [Quillaja saponaria]